MKKSEKEESKNDQKKISIPGIALLTALFWVLFFTTPGQAFTCFILILFYGDLLLNWNKEQGILFDKDRYEFDRYLLNAVTIVCMLLLATAGILTRPLIIYALTHAGMLMIDFQTNIFSGIKKQSIVKIISLGHIIAPAALLFYLLMFVIV